MQFTMQGLFLMLFFFRLLTIYEGEIADKCIQHIWLGALQESKSWFFDFWVETDWTWGKIKKQMPSSSHFLLRFLQSVMFIAVLCGQKPLPTLLLNWVTSSSSSFLLLEFSFTGVRSSRLTWLRLDCKEKTAIRVRLYKSWSLVIMGPLKATERLYYNQFKAHFRWKLLLLSVLQLISQHTQQTLLNI